MSESSFPCAVSAIETLSSDTISISLKANEGTPFIGIEPGAHIDVYAFMGALIRQYSVWQASEDGTTVSIAVKREPEGRGGSRFMHTLEVGEEIDVAGPNNHFPLNEDSNNYVLVGGGIGITPIIAMARRLKELSRNFDLYYLARSKDLAAFKSHLEAMDLGESLHLHFDDIDGVFDISTLIQSLVNDEEVYFCGPEPLLEVVIETTKGWDESRVHYERFGAMPIDAAHNKPFEMLIKSSGKTISVSPNETALQALDDAGIFVPYACESGICGSCMVDVLEGEIDHRDDIISDEDKEKNNVMCVCVSRAKGNRLVLDL